MDESKPIEQSESNAVERGEADSDVPQLPVFDAAYEAWISEPVPQHITEAYEGFIADLDELLAHRAANSADQWVAYRGKLRLGFGSDQTSLHNECLAKFSDAKFGTFSISVQPIAGTTELLSPDMSFHEVLPLIPQHVAEAAKTYLAELDELLSHLAVDPSERWVAYRGRQRLGFGSDQSDLYTACLDRFPDRKFCVYGIDACAKHLEDTVV